MALDNDNHQDILVLNAESTAQTLAKLREVKNKKMKQMESVAITLAFADASVSTPEGLVMMFQMVARCFPSLTSLEIRSDIEGDDPVVAPVNVLTAMLHPNKGPNGLKVLSLQGVRFSGDDKDFHMLTKAIRRHSTLKHCELYQTSMVNLSSGVSGMETIISALSKTLEKIVISASRLAPGGARFWSGSSLVKLCRSTTLKELKLHHIQELTEEHIVLMSQALRSNKTLRKLSLLKYEENTVDHAEKKNDKNVKNKKKRQPTKLPVESLSSEAGTLAIANMLRANNAIEELSLSAMDFNEYSAMFYGNALEADNTTLQNIWLLVPTNNGGASSFPPDEPRIDYFLRLNRAGRQKVSTLLIEEREGDDSSRAEWVESLVHCKRDVDVSFFFLSKKPSLCQI